MESYQRAPYLCLLSHCPVFDQNVQHPTAGDVGNPRLLSFFVLCCRALLAGGWKAIRKTPSIPFDSSLLLADTGIYFGAMTSHTVESQPCLSIKSPRSCRWGAIAIACLTTCLCFGVSLVWCIESRGFIRKASVSYGVRKLCSFTGALLSAEGLTKDLGSR